MVGSAAVSSLATDGSENARRTTTRASISRRRPRNWPPRPPPSLPGGDRAGRSSSSRVAGTTLAEFSTFACRLQLGVGDAGNAEIGLRRVVRMGGGRRVQAGESVEESGLAAVGETNDPEPCHVLILAKPRIVSRTGGSCL